RNISMAAAAASGLAPTAIAFGVNVARAPGAKRQPAGNCAGRRSGMAGASASENGVDDDVEIAVCVDDVRVVRAHESVSATMARPGNESRRCGACFLAVCIIWRGGFEYARTRTSGRQI